VGIVMARPVNADADATRQRMLGAAVQLFAERGLGSTSVRDVAGAAGVSLAMVHHYFGSKDELYDACIDATYAELSTMKGLLALELASAAPLAELFARAVVTSFRFAREHRTAVRLLVRAAVSSGELHPRGRKLLLEALDVVSTAVGARLERPPSELRLPLQSVVFLVARYAAQDERETAAVVGVPVREKHRVREAVEAHLVRVALDLFGLSTRGSR
jgi:AcrR family transcriptional regulator